MSIRQATAQDIPALVQLQHACYPQLSRVSLWRDEHFDGHQRNFPEGQFVAEDGGRVVAYSASFRTTSERAFSPHTFKQITQNGTFDAHVPDGDILYGAEIMVHPDYRRQGIGKRMYQARFDVMLRLGIRHFVAGGRLPGYIEHAERMSASEYVRRVVEGTLTDRVLTAQLRSGLSVKGVLPGYLSDPKSLDNAALLVREIAVEARTRPPRRPRAEGRRKSTEPRRAEAPTSA